jgi:NitT/TauT family transport system substrate-binding protein
MVELLRVTASGAGASYLPHYLAHRLGLYAAEGLDVQTDAPGGAWLARNLASGAAEVALGGIWRPLMYLGRGVTFKAFALLCIRNPQVLIGRAPMERFDWNNLRGMTVILPDGAPSPGIFFSAILRGAGLESDAVRIIRELNRDELDMLFRAGLGDFFLAMPPLSEVLVDEGFHVATTLADAGGAVPWSVFYALPEFLDRPDRPAARFARGLQGGLRWIAEHSPEETASVCAADFPTVALDTLAGAIRRARASGLWPDSVRITEEPLLRWQHTIVASGLIDQPAPHSHVVDTRPAESLESASPG